MVRSRGTRDSCGFARDRTSRRYRCLLLLNEKNIGRLLILCQRAVFSVFDDAYDFGARFRH